MSKAEFEKIKLLFVDDDTFSQKIVVMALNNFGIKNIVVAKNGNDALERLATATAGPAYDLLISDIEMPDMDGIELARRIRLGAVSKYKNLPILLLTGHGTEENVEKGRIQNIQGFIVKPPSVEALERQIKRALKIK